MTSAEAGAPPVDPRLRARRLEVRRREGRRRLRRLLAVAGALLAGLAAWGLSVSPLLDVDRVLVRGTVGERVVAVLEASGIRHGDTMATLDLGAAGSSVESVPWVDGATVRRSWPGTVVVEVTERQPLAALATADGAWALVDGDRRMVEVVAAGHDHGLPRIEGLAPPGEPGAALGEAAAGAVELSQRLVDVLPELGPGARLVSVAIAGDGSLSALLDLPGAPEVRASFGHPERLQEKVASLVALAEGLDAVPPEASLDLRVPEAPVLTRAQP